MVRDVQQIPTEKIRHQEKTCQTAATHLISYYYMKINHLMRPKEIPNH